MRESTIADWKDIHRGELAAVLMTGPSLDRYDVSTFPGLLFGVNGSWKKTTTVDYWCAQDLDDIEAMRRGEWELDVGTELFVLGRPENVAALEGEPRVVIVPRRELRKGHRLSARRVFSDDLEDGAVEHNSGLFALQVAAWMGCDPIWLLGLDCEGGHFYPDSRDSVTPHKNIARFFDQAALGFAHQRVFNANPDSAVRGFEFQDFEATFGRRTA